MCSRHNRGHCSFSCAIWAKYTWHSHTCARSAVCVNERDLHIACFDENKCIYFNRKHFILSRSGLSPPTYTAFHATPTMIPTEAALYQSPLLATPRTPQAPTHSPAHALAYYSPQLYMNMNMSYTTYYPRYKKKKSVLRFCHFSV